MKETLARLQEITRACRHDMHEPDNQGIEAVVAGHHLDNAMGNDPRHNCGEFTVGLRKDGGEMEWFNLATLIALARKAQLE